MENEKNQEIDLKNLPKYISYKAALLKEKMVLGKTNVIILSIFAVYFVVSRVEIYQLNKNLRTKEFILAPGVKDFTTAIPQSVPDSYVSNAVSDLLSSLGNVNASTIVEEYDGLKRFMSQSFRIQFEAEADKWVRQVQEEDLAQILKINSKTIKSDGKGNYYVTAIARADFYASGQYLGHENQAITMELSLIPPEENRRWYLEITHLEWDKLENFKARKELE